MLVWITLSSNSVILTFEPVIAAFDATSPSTIVPSTIFAEVIYESGISALVNGAGAPLRPKYAILRYL